MECPNSVGHHLVIEEHRVDKPKPMNCIQLPGATTRYNRQIEILKAFCHGLRKKKHIIVCKAVPQFVS